MKGTARIVRMQVTADLLGQVNEAVENGLLTKRQGKRVLVQAGVVRARKASKEPASAVVQ